MTIKLLDWNKRAVEIDVGDINNIGAMSIRVVSGDEILKVVYKDYTTKEFDSSHDRMADFYDGGYNIYNAATGVNYLNNERFMNRTSSYSFMYYDEEDEEP